MSLILSFNATDHAALGGAQKEAAAAWWREDDTGTQTGAEAAQNARESRPDYAGRRKKKEWEK